jgi:hypothetical protein
LIDRCSIKCLKSSKIFVYLWFLLASFRGLFAPQIVPVFTMSLFNSWTLPKTPVRLSEPGNLAEVVNSSKLEAVGGSYGGLLGSALEVGIVVLDVSGVGSDFCGGAIGRGKNKMCVATNCQVLSHVSHKIDLDTSDHPMEREFVFIQSAIKKPMDTSAVFVKPCIPVSRLGTKLARYLDENRSVNAWETLFYIWPQSSNLRLRMRKWK